ncbi:MAG: 50S ribosomal protein L21 [Chloroflexi bacterium]|nr:50S ribosomal protein L21 [Chloroflexota bacterium]
MYAVIEVGGKQYRVVPGQTLRVEYFPQEVGEKVELERVLLIGGGDVSLGQPVVAGAKVRAKVTAQGKGEKVLSFQYRPKKRYKKLHGHRQPLTQLLIESIILKGRTVSKIEERPATKAARPAERKAAVKKAPARKAKPKKAASKTTKKAATRKASEQ